MYDKGGGLVGNLSSTFNKASLGSYSKGTLVGDEFELIPSAPCFYSAYCETDCKLLAIDKFKMHEKIPSEVLAVMEKHAYKKLFKLRDLLKNENSKKKEIEEMDSRSKYLADTMDHM